MFDGKKIWGSIGDQWIGTEAADAAITAEIDRDHRRSWDPRTVNPALVGLRGAAKEWSSSYVDSAASLMRAAGVIRWDVMARPRDGRGGVQRWAIVATPDEWLALIEHYAGDMLAIAKDALMCVGMRPTRLSAQAYDARAEYSLVAMMERLGMRRADPGAWIRLCARAERIAEVGAS